MEREGVAADFAVFLPRDLPVADMDLCALLGNALDNAIEGSRGAGGTANHHPLQGGQGTLHAAGGEHPGRRGAAGSCNYQDGQDRPRLRHPRDAGNRGALWRHPGRRGPGTTGSSWWCACPWQGRPKHCKSPCADGRRRHRRELDFPYLRCICTEKQGGRPMDGLPVRSQSGLKASSKVRSVPRRGQ